MKKILITGILFSCGLAAYTQTFDEWFRQKKTQIQYLADQVAANQVCIEYARKGYQIARNGLGIISDLEQGGFNLHTDYFNSLKSISPVLSGYGKVAGIITSAGKITSLCKTTLQQMNKSGQFRVGEITYISQVFDKLLKQVLGEVNELEKIITAGNYEMSDDQRLERIDHLFGEVQKTLRFARNFSDEARALALQRYHEPDNL
jgi:hypothetical protein